MGGSGAEEQVVGQYRAKGHRQDQELRSGGRGPEGLLAARRKWGLHGNAPTLGSKMLLGHATKVGRERNGAVMERRPRRLGLQESSGSLFWRRRQKEDLHNPSLASLRRRRTPENAPYFKSSEGGSVSPFTFSPTRENGLSKGILHSTTGITGEI